MSIAIRVCTKTDMHSSMRHVYIHIFLYMYIHIHTYIYVHPYVYIYICMYQHIFVHSDTIAKIPHLPRLVAGVAHLRLIITALAANKYIYIYICATYMYIYIYMC